MKRISTLSLSLAAAFLVCSPAIATTSGSVVANSSSPIAPTQCHTDGDNRYVTLFNRTTSTLKTFTIHWSAFDSSGKKLGEADQDFTPDPPLKAAATDGYYGPIPTSAFTTGPESSIARFSCAIDAAGFSNGSTWAPGKAWSGKLLPVPSASSSKLAKTSGGNGGNVAHGIQVTVSKSWTDVDSTSNPPNYFIHDTLVIQGANREVTITGDQFLLTMHLTNGGIARFVGLTKAAPSYTKLNFAGNDGITVPEIDPSSDLGAIGSVIVPAGGTVTITVTFVTNVAPANPTSNPDVQYKG